MLHFKKNLQQRTVFGGIITLIVLIIVMVIAGNKLIRMFRRGDPSILSIEAENTDSTVYTLADMPMTILHITEEGTPKFQEDIRPYIHIRAVNLFNTFDEQGNLS